MRYSLTPLLLLFACTTVDPPSTETDCLDQIDQDLDGDIDCADSDCAEEPNCQATLEICNDTLDNDQDGDADCDDSECISAQNCEVLPPEDCALDTDDEDEDGLTNCQDPDCATDPVCGVELCDDGIDNDGNFAIDCADAGCAQAANCQGPQPEQCGDGIDNDEDTDIDCEDTDCVTAPECAGAVCSPADDQCGGNNICIGINCENAFGRSYRFSGFVLALGPIDRSGGTWDSNNNPPDPKVELHINGNKVLETGNKSNVFNATYTEVLNRTINLGDVLEVRVLDVDGNADDLALSCFADPISAALLRGRSLVCQNNVGGNNIGNVTFNVTPN